MHVRIEKIVADVQIWNHNNLLTVKNNSKPQKIIPGLYLLMYKRAYFNLKCYRLLLLLLAIFSLRWAKFWIWWLVTQDMYFVANHCLYYTQGYKWRYSIIIIGHKVLIQTNQPNGTILEIKWQHVIISVQYWIEWNWNRKIKLRIFYLGSTGSVVRSL